MNHSATVHGDLSEIIRGRDPIIIPFTWAIMFQMTHMYTLIKKYMFSYLLYPQHTHEQKIKLIYVFVARTTIQDYH